MPPSVTVTVSGPGAPPARTSIASSWLRSSMTSQTRVVPSADREERRRTTELAAQASGSPTTVPPATRTVASVAGTGAEGDPEGQHRALRSGRGSIGPPHRGNPARGLRRGAPGRDGQQPRDDERARGPCCGHAAI